MINKIDPAGQFALLVFLVISSSMWAVVYINDVISPSTMHHSEILTDYNQRLIKLEEHSDVIEQSVDDKYKILRESVKTELDNLELSKYAKIYDLDITICKAEHYQDHISDIKKRTVRMKNVVGINPSVERTAIVIETWLWYGSSVEIPTIMDDPDEYACGLEVISVR